MSNGVMNYELFKEVVEEKFSSYMPEKYQHMQVKIHPVNKINKVLDGLSIISNESGSECSPTIYVNYMYEYYIQTGDLNKVLKNSANAMTDAFEQMPNHISMDLSTAKDNIIFQVVNTIQNEDMLKDIPHREFLDLSIIYRWMIGSNGNDILSAVIRNDLAERLGFNEEQLFKLAAENTKRLLPPVIKNMDDMISGIYHDFELPVELKEIIVEIPPVEQMYIISNNKGTNGAASMLYEDLLHDLAEKLDSDLYIIPSSIHEVLAISCNIIGEPNELAQFISEVNMEHISLNERLSNQVYHYDKELRKLSLATDTPNKRLDGILM